MALTNIEQPSWASIADAAATVFEELSTDLSGTPSWRKRPSTCPWSALRDQAPTDHRALASLDQFSGFSEVPSEGPLVESRRPGPTASTSRSRTQP